MCSGEFFGPNHFSAPLVIKRNAEHLVNRLEPIAQSLDVVQKDKCSMAEAVHIWKRLQVKFNELNLDKSNMKFFT